MKPSVMRNLLGLHPSASEAEIVAAAAELKRRVDTAGRNLVELAITRGLLPYTQRTWALEFARTDPAGFAELLQHTPPAASLEQQITNAAREKVAASGGQLALAAAIHEVEREHPDLIEAYRTERRAQTRTQLRRIS